MTEKSITREALLTSFGTLATKFTSSLEKAQALEQAFEGSRTELVRAISSHLQIAQNSLPDTNPLQGLLNDFVATMAKTSREWDVKVAGRQKGVQFRDEFEDSLLIFISGKVKSGKSSLGNYMAWGNTDPTDDIKRQTPPERHPKYKSHDRENVEGGDSDKEAAIKHEFRVGATETTSSIQSFSLPGLTWVDSPGLHSLKKENGDLARRYLDYADLILYTIKSDSPGRASDLAEIVELIHKDKRTLLLLTGSDDIQEDINDDSKELIQCLVMKDAELCAKQQGYVRQALKELIDKLEKLKELPDAEKLNNFFKEDELKKLSDPNKQKELEKLKKLLIPEKLEKLKVLLREGKPEIFSVSSRYAQKNSSDQNAFLDSGIGHFCATLQEICQSEGIKIKQSVPIKNLHNFLMSCNKDLVPYQNLINDFRPVLKKIDKNLKKQISMHSRNGKSELKRFINKFFRNIESSRDDADRINSQLKDFNSKLEEKFQEIATERLQAIADSLTKEFKSNTKNIYQHSLLLKIPDFKLDTITEEVEDGTKPGTKKRNAGIGSLIGGLLGLALGGPPGAGIGSMVGGGLGGATGDVATIRRRDVQIIVGDNLQDISRTLLKNHYEVLETILQNSSTNLWQKFDGEIQNLLNQLSVEISKFDSELKETLKKIQLTL